MTRAKNNNPEDSDILHMDDIVPPYDASKKSKRRSRKKTNNSGETAPGTNSNQAEQSPDSIPKLDLNRQLMARQRKATAVRRKGPADKVEQAAGPPPPRPAEPSRRVLSEQQKIVAEIVARDIRKMCSG